MKKLLFFTILCCIFMNAGAQKDYRNGFIITNAADTIRGLINYKVAAKKFEYCDFKNAVTGKTNKFFPNQLLGYGFDEDAYFQSRFVMNRDSILEHNFIQVLVSGKASLYKIRGAFYIEKQDTLLRELTYENRKVVIDRREYSKRHNTYVGVLRYLLSDCSSIKTRINNVLLNERRLVRLLEDYNNCIERPSITYKTKKKWLNIEPGLAVAMNAVKLSINSEIPSGISNLRGDFNSNYSLTPMVYFDLSSPRINERIALHLGASYYVSSFEKFEILESVNFTERNEISIDLKQLKVPVALRYTFAGKKFTPFLTAGFLSVIHVDSKYKWQVEREVDSVVESTEAFPLDFSDTLFGYGFGLGAKKSISSNISAFIEARYENYGGTAYRGIGGRSASGASIGYDLSNFQFIIGLSF